MKTIICERVIHDNEIRVTLNFPYDNELIRSVKSIQGARWSKRMHCWHIPDNMELTTVLTELFKGKANIDFSAFHDDLTGSLREPVVKDSEGKETTAGTTGNINFLPLSEKGKADIARFRKWLEANRYPESTVRTYTGMMTTFLRFVSPREADECDSGDLIRIVDEYILPN